MIKIEKITKKFGDIIALSEISFKIEKGEFVFLTGPSGAGKTTLIKLLLVEYLPTFGEIEINGEKLSKVSKNKLYLWRRKIGVVFQDYKLFPDQTVLENVALPLQISKTPSAELNEKVDKILNLVGLSERAQLFPAQLSGGELQRASLARAVVTGPEILLADEPTGNLDPKTSAEMMELFKEINKKGTTILMATHNRGVVDSFKGRVIELDKGKLIRDEAEGEYQAKDQKSNIKSQKENKDA
ncbi:cell division ATP-binding protein FtsE [Candidatus Shapirobacteria bacterium CG03_land_8_20_14_0_80_39_12]|uniref:Cell division ATP-binding protein FtsE n=1 Tax=Candidatus Shapirobacteria bacterium CG03_land_8_20_14_0_80_39_12 TaxID=1974879 RepID=A0A2M7BF44_9BACT|nr:MAG: cell division ATP-binding protein FtsE [Candidatus Shapirobacteria bacterium CG03_land_8_20_14_0_80_39_12]